MVSEKLKKLLNEGRTREEGDMKPDRLFVEILRDENQLDTFTKLLEE